MSTVNMERPTGAGAVFAYRHHNGSLGSLVVLACNTDFVARCEPFVRLGEALALQVAALGPASVEELLAQPFLKDDSRTVRQLVAEVAAETGETVVVREFFRAKV